MRVFIFAIILCAHTVFGAAIIIPHEELLPFIAGQNSLTGIATAPLGAQQSEVWSSSIAVGSKTPLHYHSTEEIVILLTGKLEALVEGVSSSCSAPCTIILPAFKLHELRNIGDVPTNHILVMPAKSRVCDIDGGEMTCPWRNQKLNLVSKSLQ